MIELPFPTLYLFSNKKGHWAEKHNAFKTYKAHCMWAMTPHKKDLIGVRKYVITFHPPHRKHDRDNIIAAFKAGQDAISGICNVNDRLFEVTYRFGEPRPNGAVLVEPLKEQEAA